MNPLLPGKTFSKNGVTLTVDFIHNGEVFFKKHRDRLPGVEPTEDDDWERFLGLFRAPISEFARGLNPDHPVA